MTYYKVYIKDREIYSGGTFLDCWRWLLFTYGNMTLKELIDDNVTIETVKD
jgi:hypothetical protein